MLVQIATFIESSNEMDEGIRHVREEVVPAIAEADGLKAAYGAVDRDGGKRLSMMVWESPDAAAAAIPRVVESIKRRRTEAGLTEPQASPKEVERFEVVAAL